MPITYEELLELTETHSKLACEQLRKKWLPDVCSIIDSFKDDIESLMPLDEPVIKPRIIAYL